MAQAVAKLPEYPATVGRELRPTWPGMERRVGDLLDMLTYQRSGGSKYERRFCNRYLRDIAKQDAYGNFIAVVGSENPTIAWCSHTDSVHRNGGRQRIEIDAKGWITAPGSSCLGADDAVGVWIMREMIYAQVPGLYIFHRDEETGGGGSNWIAKHTPELLDGITHAIAFDRMAFTSVITHQTGGRCCSDAFAKELCTRLGDYWEPDEWGIFTDTANYTDLVAECTNISVGYEDQHSKNERCHLPFAVCLLDRMLTTDWSGLPIGRKAGETEPRDWTRYYYGGQTHKFSGYSGHEIHDVKDEWDEPKFRSSDPHTELRYVVKQYPDAIASILEDYGISADDVYSYIGNTWGTER